MELLIAAQCSESFDELQQKFKGSLEILETSSSSDDLKIRIIDRICYLLYQDSNFGLVKEESSKNRKIVLFLRRLCKLWIDKIEEYKNSNSDFLAGDVISSCAVERIFSSWLIICELLGESAISEIQKFAKIYPTTLDFCQKLLNNDERCLTTIILLLPYSSRGLEANSIFHAPLIVLSIFFLVDFDTAIIIDWLNSELVAISAFLRILKSFERNWETWRNIDVEQSIIITTTSQKTTEVSQPNQKLELNIIELIGHQKSSKSIQISRKSQQIHGSNHQIQIHCNFATCHRRFQKMLEILAEKLEALRKRRLVPENYTRIIALCLRVAKL
ncbi:unnamed protein product [Caenorhabditis angaria]|uniref:Uncharacterized protein n=1 Tax=Caenorhabditis angaria TaxID=860376 RepID=A0A9P1IPU7_9PELO|nr:unnamed protein product [Caenorhabditis angaria]